MIISGIYKIQSKIKPERIYMGSSFHIKERWRHHCDDLRKNKHKNRILQNHYNKYGEEDLVFTIIEPCLPAFLITREQWHLDKYRPYFNICKIAASCLGVKRTEEQIRNMSKALKGRKSPMKGVHHSLEMKQRISRKLKGRKIPASVIEKRSNSRRGVKRKPFTDEWKKHLSESLKGRQSPRKGVHLSESEIHKLSERMKGKRYHCVPHTEETKEKIRLKILGTINTAESNKKRSLSMTGRKHTEEAKAKMRGRILSEETKKRISEAKKGKTIKPPTGKTKKILSERLKIWWVEHKKTNVA